MSENEEIDNVIYTKEDQINISSDYINNEQIQCQPCSLLNKTTFAVRYCNDCYENLCEKCVESHARRKATSTHKPILFDKIKKANTFRCFPCVEFNKISSAVTYCKDCEEYLCTECTRVHIIRKATRFHEPLGLEQFKDQINQSDEILPSCVPCKYNNINSRSSYYCEDCDENLCEQCTMIHRSRKATHKHVPVPISSIKQRDNEVSGDKDRKLCFPCQIVDLEKIAKSFCIECEELLCDECTNQHRSNKITKTHTIDSPKSIEFELMYCDICNIEKEAVLFCNMCDEALCDSCAHKHAKRKASKTHSTKPVEGKALKRIIVCDLCGENDKVRKAASFCNTCEENYCETCTRQHQKRKATKLHELKNPALSPATSKQILDTCDECKGTTLHAKASYRCLFCKVKLCSPCQQTHKKQTATTNHKVVNMDADPKIDSEMCGQCEDGNVASKHCSQCQLYLCADCSVIHRRSKFTQTHELLENDEIEERKQHDCDSCKTIGAANFFCEQCEEFFCKLCNKQHQGILAYSQHKLVSAEKGMILNMAKLDVGGKKGSRGDFIASDIIPKEVHEKDCPGKPRCSDILTDAVSLSWDPPTSFGKNDFYQVSFKDIDSVKKWKFYQEKFMSATAVLRGLTSDTSFIFRVRVVHEDDEGSFSEESDKVITLNSPASRIVKFSLVIQKGNPSPTIYALPIIEVRTARNERAKTKKYEVGIPPSQIVKSKTIMLVGAGKSTLVDGIVNYVLGVNWDDPFRFTVLDLEQEEKDRATNQACSHKEWITCYTLNPEKGSRLKYQFHIIDTPGFGDRGLKRDQEIVEQIRQLLSEREPKGVTFIDAVCFIIKAPDARLTAVQSYIFQSVISLFGRDIEKNICSLVTFADGLDPPVLAALQVSGLPFGKCFTFNNSGLFARNSGICCSSLTPMYWDMGLKSFRGFFDHLEQVETKSLQLTKDVLDERSRLEATVKNLQPQLDAGQSKINCLKQEKQILERQKTIVKDNKNFEYEVEETRQEIKELPRGFSILNCLSCHFTCHNKSDRCVFTTNDDQAKCCAMDGKGYCMICPDKCHWRQHANTPYIFEYVTVKVKKTYADMQRKYQEASGKLLFQEQIVEKLGEELGGLLDDIEDKMVVIKSCNERLKEIALRPKPLSMTEHIDLMVENEKREKKPGFLQRINVLYEFRKRAEISNDFESFCKEAHSALGAAGKKRNRDAKSLLARFSSLVLRISDVSRYKTTNT